MAYPACFSSISVQLVWACLVQTLCSVQALPQTLQGHSMAGLGKALLVFFSFLPNQLTVNPWHTTSLKGHQTIYPAERWVKTYRPTLTRYQLILQITEKLTKSQEDKPAVMQALSKAIPDLTEGISSRNFPPLLVRAWLLEFSLKKETDLGEDRR